MYEDGFFEGWDGTPLYFRSWTVSDPAGTVVIIHGVGEHSGRHEETAGHLAGNGLNVYAYDQRGHGRSGGRRGHVLSFSEYRHDMERCVERCMEFGTRPFLLGQSLGGLEVLDYGLNGRHPVEGIVACSPALELAFVPAWYNRLIGNIASFLAPALLLKDNSVSAEMLSHDGAVVEECKDDPLVHSSRSARFYTELMRAMRETREQAGDLDVPCLLLQAGDDRIVSAEAVVRFYDALGSDDKDLKVYAGFYHEILKDVGRERPLADLTRWILYRASRR